MMRNSRVTVLISLVVMLLAAGSLTACGGEGVLAAETDDLLMASLDGMPAEVQSAPTIVRQAYRFAVANPEVMTQIPCYCGCGNMGHSSNYSCYIKGVEEQGTITYDTHALGCSICVDITQDAMRYRGQAKTTSEIWALIDQTYSQYGPSNMP